MAETEKKTYKPPFKNGYVVIGKKPKRVETKKIKQEGGSK